MMFGCGYLECDVTRLHFQARADAFEGPAALVVTVRRQKYQGVDGNENVAC